MHPTEYTEGNHIWNEKRKWIVLRFFPCLAAIHFWIAKCLRVFISNTCLVFIRNKLNFFEDLNSLQIICTMNVSPLNLFLFFT